jgi:hypothetical protein
MHEIGICWRASWSTDSFGIQLLTSATVVQNGDENMDEAIRTLPDIAKIAAQASQALTAREAAF